MSDRTDRTDRTSTGKRGKVGKRLSIPFIGKRSSSSVSDTSNSNSNSNSTNSSSSTLNGENDSQDEIDEVQSLGGRISDEDPKKDIIRRYSSPISRKEPKINEADTWSTSLIKFLKSIYSSDSLYELEQRIKRDMGEIFETEDVAIYFVDYLSEHLYNVDESDRKLSPLTPFSEAGFLMPSISKSKIISKRAEMPGSTQEYEIPGGIKGGKGLHRAVIPIISGITLQPCMLLVVSRLPHRSPFLSSSKDFKLFEVVSEHIATAYTKLIKIDELEKKLSEHRLLQNVTKSLYVEGKTAKTIIPKILRHATSYIGAERCSLFMLDKVRDEIYTKEYEVNHPHGSNSVNRSKTFVTIHRELSIASKSKRYSHQRNKSEKSGGSKIKRNTSDSDILNSKKEDTDDFDVTGVAGIVVKTGETLNITDAYKDERFDQEIDKETNNKTKTILCTPVRNHSGEVIGVIQLVNKKIGVFTDDDAEWFETYCIICNLAILNAFVAEQENKRLIEKATIQQAATTISEPFNIKELLKSILNNCRSLVSAEYCSIFLLTEDNKTQMVRAACECFPAVENEDPPKFSIAKGIAGHVLTTGKLENVQEPCAYNKYDIEIDSIPGNSINSISSILCLPIIFGSEVLGCLQLINKDKGNFTRADEEQMETMTNVIGISINNSRQLDMIKRTETQSKIAFEIIHYHTHFKPEELEALSTPLPEELLLNSDSYTWDCRSLTSLQMCSFVMHMYESLYFSAKYDLQSETLKKFALTVRNNYRDVPYHNWPHAFSVSQCFFSIAMNAELHNYLEPYEIFAQLTACLVHDIDHRGKNNAFLASSESSLKSLYGDKSILEHHHYHHFADLIKNPSLDILENVSDKERSLIMDQIKFNILSTDLSCHFGVLKKFKTLFCGGDENPTKIPYDKTNKEHRRMVASMLMTICDISGSTKPWDSHVTITNQIYEEFFEQGDEEKKAGRKPIEMMDREIAYIPRCQLGFMNFVCTPAYEAIVSLIPGMQPLLDGIMVNKVRWEDIKAKGDAEREKAKREADEKKPIFIPSL